MLIACDNKECMRWFHCQCVGMLVAVANQTEGVPHFRANTHSSLGLALTAVVVAQIALAFRRPKRAKTPKTHRAWRTSHQLLGYGMVATSAYLVTSGVKLLGEAATLVGRKHSIC